MKDKFSQAAYFRGKEDCMIGLAIKPGNAQLLLPGGSGGWAGTKAGETNKKKRNGREDCNAAKWQIFAAARRRKFYGLKLLQICYNYISNL